MAACFGDPDGDNGVIWLSHWKLGSHQLEGGDQVTVSVFTIHSFQVIECGIQLVHEQEDCMSTQHNSADPCYPYVTGADLSEIFMPRTYFLKGGSLYTVESGLFDHWKKQVWFSDIFGDSDGETDNEERQLQGDEPLALAAAETLVEAERASNNRHRRGYKIIIILATVFFLFLSLVLSLALLSLSERNDRPQVLNENCCI